MAHQDLERPDLNELDWAGEQRSNSLSAVFTHAVGLAKEAEDWYATMRRGKRRWGRTLRVGAIASGALAGVLPILTQIFASDGTPPIAPGWAAVALAVAATLVGFDRYFGFSTAWMRFTAAELQITRLRHDFEYGWQAERATATSRDALPDSAVVALLERARQFVIAIDEVITEETSAWIAEFRTSLESIETGLESANRP